MFTPEMSYSEALKIIADAYATKSKQEADEIYAEYQKVSDDILRHELEQQNVLTSYHYNND